ncbi:MAG: helix-turn-helix transcriptional regulator [Hyphomicrobiales bacterium]|nr:helix-turn-helix transcriptional regulator [Hyphomicrobiales bacterium]
MRDAIDHMKAALAEPLTLASVADQVAVSSRSLARKFSAELGMSWGDALRRLRLLEAIEILAAGGMPITEVALSVVYNSLSAFNAAFRDLVGKTPSEYRKSFSNA